MEATSQTPRGPVLAAVVPCYREVENVLDVLGRIDDAVRHVIVVDDGCPDQTGLHVEQNCSDPRVEVIRLEANHGVGGATMAGYRRALELGADILVKLDGDGQMDPSMIKTLVRPVASGRADYSKGNRFHNLDGLAGMPVLRLIGNLALSFASKMSSGYWNVFDPTNGFTAIHGKVAAQLPFAKIDEGYFFESDMLFRLNIARAVVADVPMQAIYGDEKSSLRIWRVLFPFLAKHARNLARRVLYSYFVRDFSIASVELLAGLVLVGFGTIYGAVKWHESATSGVPATAGAVILAALPFLVGSQLLISFLNFDTHNQPQVPLQLDL